MAEISATPSSPSSNSSRRSPRSPAHAPPIGSDEVRPEQLISSRALLGDGCTHDYAGAHPSHVDTGAGRVPVLTVYNL